MSLHRGRFVAVLALSLVVTFSGYGKVGITGVTSIQLTAPNTNCLQNGATGNVQFGQEGVCWTGPNATTPVTVQLPANCPFKNCTFPTSSGSMCSGPTKAGIPSGGASWTYTSITIGGSSCAVGNDGLIMK
jgi:hypothetical protein